MQQKNSKISLIQILMIALSITLIQSKLIYMTDVANPGARYPINDVYDGKANPEMQGQLNSVGMRQQFLLGTYLRADYIDQVKLIDQKYNPNTVEVFAVGAVDRTYDSALSRLYGLFPLGSGWEIPSSVPKERLEPPFQSNFSYRGLNDKQANEAFGLDSGYQPVPIWPLDDVLNDACPNAGVLKTKRLQQISKNLTAFQAQHSALMSKVKLVFNLSTLQMNIPTMADLHDTLLSDLTLGKDLPKQFDDYDRKSLKFISDYYNTLLYDGTYAQTFSTLLLSTLKSKMQFARTHKTTKSWSMFFTKQGTIPPLLTLLNLTSTNCLTQRWKNQPVTDINCMQPATFSTNMLWELHQDDAFQHYIRIKYNGEYVALCGSKETKCQYRDFWARVKIIDIKEYNAICYGK